VEATSDRAGGTFFDPGSAPGSGSTVAARCGTVEHFTAT